MHQNGQEIIADDVTMHLLKTTSNSDRDARLLKWDGFHGISSAERRCLAAQALPVANELSFSAFGILVDAEWKLLADELISFCMIVRAWERLLKSASK